MSKCIFCLATEVTKFNTKEHILPESLGGGEWAILPDGLYCDDCQNKFGSTIEQQALADYPFITLRTILGIPTKKGKAPWFKYLEGTLYSAGESGKIIYEPNGYFKKAFESGQKIHTIIPTTTRKPSMMLRTLIKIGLETIAANDPKIIFEDRFNAAREYALTGFKKNPWFYIQKENDELFQLYLKNIEWKDNHNFMDVHYKENGLVFLHLRILYLEFLVPLIEDMSLKADVDLENSKESLFIV